MFSLVIEKPPSDFQIDNKVNKMPELTKEKNLSNYSKCKQCKNCVKHYVVRKNRDGNDVKYTYCQGGSEEHDKSNWLFISSGYLRSANYVGDKLVYYHRQFIENESNQIDHIDGCTANCALDNLYECTAVENTQNKHDKEGLHFHNVKKNKKSYTAFKVLDGKTINIANCETDLAAYDQFVKFCEENNIPINPNTTAYKCYDALKSTNSPYNCGVDITGGIPHDYSKNL